MTLEEHVDTHIVGRREVLGHSVSKAVLPRCYGSRRARHGLEEQGFKISVEKTPSREDHGDAPQPGDRFHLRVEKIGRIPLDLLAS